MPKHVKLSVEAASATQHSKQGAQPAHLSRLTRGEVRARPTAFGVADILAMQRMVGNRAVGRILEVRSSPIPQTSIAIQRNGDPYKEKIKKNMTFVKIVDGDPTYRIEPLGKVDNVEKYCQLMKANGFAFNQKVLLKSKYERIKGVCEPNEKDMVDSSTIKTVNRW